MNRLLIVLVVMFAVACGSHQQPPIGTVWVNTFEKCPTSAEYGEEVVNAVNIWRDKQRTPPQVTLISHGTEIDLLSDEGDFLKVRYDNQDGYIQRLMTSEYNPRRGVQPDEASCL